MKECQAKTRKSLPPFPDSKSPNKVTASAEIAHPYNRATLAVDRKG